MGSMCEFLPGYSFHSEWQCSIVLCSGSSSSSRPLLSCVYVYVAVHEITPGSFQQALDLGHFRGKDTWPLVGHLFVFFINCDHGHQDQTEGHTQPWLGCRW